MLRIWLLYVYWSIFDRKIKMKTNAMNMRSHIMICIKLKLLRKRFMSMLQIQNSQAVWIKFKCNDSSWEQPLHILGVMKWMIDGAESGKIFKTLLICCVLGKYDASYSVLFCWWRRVWNKNGWIGVLFPFSSQVKTPLVFLNFDSWFYEWAEGVKVTRTYRKIKQFLCIKIEQWNSSQSHGDSPFF